MSKKKKPTKKKLRKRTPRQERFCEEYIIDLNGKKAAERAGFSKKTAEVIAYQLLQKPLVKARIKELIDKRTKATQATAEDVLRELSGILKVNMLDFCTIGDDGFPYVDMSAITREQGALIQSVDVDHYIEEDGKNGKTIKKVKVKFWDKMKAADLLGKYHKLFIDRVEVGGPDGKPIQYQDISGFTIEQLAALIAQEREG